MESVLVAFSGGVDSTFLLKVALETLGDQVLAVTARSEIHASRELQAAEEIARRLGANHIFIETHELADPVFTSNPPDRCYSCKRGLFLRLNQVAAEYSLTQIVDGSNYDDRSEYRPGRKAARECGVRSPLEEARLTKEDIRLLSQEMGLATWDKPAVPCLATRFPYGSEITVEGLRRVEKAEEFLYSLGAGQLRVRDHGTVARIEVGSDDIPLLLRDDVVVQVIHELTELGYRYVTLDLKGFRSGSMDEVLNKTGA
jgi:uncharacterized protein